MANRFEKYRAAVQPTPATVQNRFAKYAKPQDVAKAQADPDVERGALPKTEGPQVPVSGKGDRGLGTGEVASETYIDDIGRSALSGFRSGVEMLAGTPGDVQDLAGRGMSYVAEKLGAGPQTLERMKQLADVAAIPGLRRMPRSSEITTATDRIFGPGYEPQTTPGKYARTVGEFAPNAVAGPGGVIRKTAMTVIPALASEAAGQLTEGSKYQPIAKAGAAVLTTLATGGRGNSTKILAKGAPSQEQVAQQVNAQYRTLRNSGINYDPKQLIRIVNYAGRKLQSEGIMAADAPRTHGVVTRMAELAQNGNPDFSQLESIRKGASAIMREGPAVSNTDKMAAGLIVEAIDRFSAGARVLSATGQNIGPAAAKLAKETRELAQRNIIAKKIDDLLAKAEPAQAGFQSGIRNKFGSFLASNEGLRLKKFDPELYKAMFKAAKGTFTTNLVSHLARFGIDPSKAGNIAALIPFGGAAYYTAQGDNEKAAALLAAGTVAKIASRNAALKFAQDARKVALAGRTARKSVGAAVAERNAATARTGALSARESQDAPWPDNAFLRDAKGNFFDRNGHLIRPLQ